MSTEAEPWVMMLGLQAIASPWREAGLPLMGDVPGAWLLPERSIGAASYHRRLLEHAGMERSGIPAQASNHGGVYSWDYATLHPSRAAPDSEMIRTRFDSSSLSQPKDLEQPKRASIISCSTSLAPVSGKSRKDRWIRRFVPSFENMFDRIGGMSVGKQCL
jgi:hypothetical protein